MSTFVKKLRNLEKCGGGSLYTPLLRLFCPVFTTAGWPVMTDDWRRKKWIDLDIHLVVVIAKAIENQNSLSSVVTAPELVSTAVFFHTLLQFLQSSHFSTDFSGFCHFRDKLKAGPLKVVWIILHQKYIRNLDLDVHLVLCGLKIDSKALQINILL